MTRCYIGLGANLGDCIATLSQAAQALEGTPEYTNVRRSALYRSRAVGPGEQADYLNAVIGLDTQRAPLEVLDHLQELERGAGRRRDIRWGPRTLDLDLLLYGSQIIDSVRLSVPHPRMVERNFVLEPLTEIAGADLLLPEGRRLADALRACTANPLQRLSDAWMDRVAIGALP